MIPNRQKYEETGLSIVDATTIDLDSDSAFDNFDTTFNIVITPDAVGTGTVALSWASGAAPTAFITAVNDLGVAMVANMADAVSIFTVSGIDLCKLKCTPSGIGTTTSYSVAVVSIGK